MAGESERVWGGSALEMAGPLWWLLRPLVVAGSAWIAAGTLPPRAREQLGLDWSARDERMLRVLAAARDLAADPARPAVLPARTPGLAARGALTPPTRHALGSIAVATTLGGPP